MSVIYSCDICEKEFNLNIKLKKHKASAHAAVKEEVKSKDYLDPKVTFTDKEKILYYDDLKAKTEELEEKIKILEENQNPKPKIQKSKRRSAKVTVTELDENRYDLIENDETIPEGWKSARSKHIFRGVKSKVFLSPDQKFFPSRRLALTHMVHVLKSSQEDIQIMKNGFLEEGWSKIDHILDGWLMKSKPRDGRMNAVFLSDQLSLLTSQRNVIAELIKKDYSDQHIKNFLCYIVKKSLNPEDIQLEPGLQQDFYRKCVISTEDFYLTIDGDVLNSIKRVWKNLKMSKVQFTKPPQIESKRKRKARRPYALTAEDVKIQNVVVKPHQVIEASDSFCPNNWKVYRRHEDDQKLFQCPEGKFYNRHNSLKKMFTEKYSEEDLEEMKRGLVEEEGWSSPDFMPPGWLYKLYSKGGSHRVMTPTFVMVKVLWETMNDYFIRCGVTEDQILKFKTGMGWRESQDLPVGCFESTRTKDGQEYKVYLAPDNTYCANAAQLYRKYVSHSQPSGEELYKLGIILEQEGWTCQEYLPTNWRMRKVNSERSKTEFLTDKGERMKSSIVCYKYLVENNFPTKIIQNFTSKFKRSLNASSPRTETFTPKIGSKVVNKTSKYLNSALKHKKTQLKSLKESDEEVKKSKPKLKKQIKEEGFEPAYYLPEGWSVNEGGLRKKFRTPTGEVLNGVKDVVDFMKHKGVTEDRIDMFKENYSSIPFTKQDGLPQGWMSAIMSLTNGMKACKLLSPCGIFFNGRNSAIKFMIEQNHPEEDIKKMKELLVTEDGWIPDDNMPPGWLRKDPSSGSIFMSPTFDIIRDHIKKKVKEYLFTTNIDAVDITMAYLKNRLRKHQSVNQQTTAASEIILKRKIKEEPSEHSPKKARKDLFPVWRSDPSLPSDWSMIDTGDNIQISNNKGDIFKSRMEAIDHMIQNQQPPTDIFKLWNNLHLEGWNIDDENLPDGWRIKHLPDSTHHYLSPLMELVTTGQDLLKHVNNDDDCSEDDIVKVRNWILNH